MSPQLPGIQILDERFDNLDLEDQVAMWGNATVVNEHRRHVAEGLLARCAKWIRER